MVFAQTGTTPHRPHTVAVPIYFTGQNPSKSDKNEFSFIFLLIQKRITQRPITNHTLTHRNSTIKAIN